MFGVPNTNFLLTVGAKRLHHFPQVQHGRGWGPFDPRSGTSRQGLGFEELGAGTISLIDLWLAHRTSLQLPGRFIENVFVSCLFDCSYANSASRP